MPLIIKDVAQLTSTAVAHYWTTLDTQAKNRIPATPIEAVEEL